MAAPGPGTGRKNQVIDMVLVALGTSHQGLPALRDVLASDPRFSVLDGVVDLQPVWQVLEAQPDFSRDAATSAMCFVKHLEPKLGVQIKLPPALEAMGAQERASSAARCPARREDVDKVLAGVDLRRASTEVQVAVGRKPASSSKRQMIGIAAVLVSVLSVSFLVYSIASSMTQTPKFKRLNAADFAGDIPIGSALVWGSEVRAALVDPAWRRQPQDRRRKQLESALDRLSGRQVSTLIIEDEAHRTVATAQLLGRTRKIMVRFF